MLHVYNLIFLFLYTLQHHQKFSFHLPLYSWSPLPISTALPPSPLVATTLFSVSTVCVCFFHCFNPSIADTCGATYLLGIVGTVLKALKNVFKLPLPLQCWPRTLFSFYVLGEEPPHQQPSSTSQWDLLSGKWISCLNAKGHWPDHTTARPLRFLQRWPQFPPLPPNVYFLPDWGGGFRDPRLEAIELLPCLAV